MPASSMAAGLAAYAEPVHALAMRAATEILRIYASDFAIHLKADRTPVTAADLAAHAVLCEGLARLTPDIPVLSEESTPEERALRLSWPRLWLVDPLDGTREFVARSGEFSINVALIEAHEAVFGLILMPVSGDAYWAWRGGGAWKLAAGTPAQPIRCRPLGPAAVRVAGSRSHGGHLLQTYLGHLGRHVYRGIGSALKACLIAEGEADVYPRFGPTCEWDTAASQILLEEAGGGLCDAARRPLRYNARQTLINPDFLAFGDAGHDWTRYLPRRRPPP